MKRPSSFILVLKNSNVKETHGHQGLQRFAKGRAADAKLFDKLPLGRETIPRFQLSLADKGFDLFCYLVRDFGPLNGFEHQISPMVLPFYKGHHFLSTNK